VSYLHRQLREARGYMHRLHSRRQVPKYIQQQISIHIFIYTDQANFKHVNNTPNYKHTNHQYNTQQNTDQTQVHKIRYFTWSYATERNATTTVRYRHNKHLRIRMIANIIASAVDGQRIDLTAVVHTRGPQTTSKTGTPKRTIMLADPSGTIELTLLREGACMADHLSRGDTVAITNAKVGIWNGNASLLMFTAPPISNDIALRTWWSQDRRKEDALTINTILGLPDQKIINNVIGLVVSTEEASATKSGGTKRKFTIADGSTTGSIDVCFAGKLAAARPTYTVGSVVLMATARVGVWQDTRSLLIFDPPTCATQDDAATKDIRSWIQAGGSAIHNSLSLREMCDAADEQRVDLLPVVVCGISERTMTSGGSLWKRNLQVADETTHSVEICTFGAAAEAELHIGDIIGIKRAKVCSYNGTRGAVVFDAPGRVADNDHMKAWWRQRNQSDDHDTTTQQATSPSDDTPRLSNIPTMADGTHVILPAVVVINDNTITDTTGITISVTFTKPLSGQFIRIDDAKVVGGELIVSSFTDITDTALAVWWEQHEDDKLPCAKDAPQSMISEWPF
jgi:hypothetical protein